MSGERLHDSVREASTTGISLIEICINCYLLCFNDALTFNDTVTYLPFCS